MIGDTRARTALEPGTYAASISSAVAAATASVNPGAVHRGHRFAVAGDRDVDELLHRAPGLLPKTK
jgi:hypothetical protein